MLSGAYHISKAALIRSIQGNIDDMRAELATSPSDGYRERLESALAYFQAERRQYNVPGNPCICPRCKP